MKVNVYCPDCTDYKTATPVTWSAPVSVQGINSSPCPKCGKATLFMLQTPFYWLLFLRAMSALARRDTRDAVLDAYAAWDTFVARACALLLDEFGANEAAKAVPSRLKKAEPLAGMFAGLYAAKTTKWPRLVSTKTQESRNSVIHGDHIPTEEEALSVLEEVRACVHAFWQALPAVLDKDEQGDAASARMTEYGRKYKEATGLPGWKQMLTVALPVRPHLDVKAEVEAMRQETWPEFVR